MQTLEKRAHLLHLDRGQQEKASARCAIRTREGTLRTCVVSGLVYCDNAVFNDSDLDKCLHV